MPAQKISYLCLIECLKQSKNRLWMVKGDFNKYHKVSLNDTNEIIQINEIDVDQNIWEKSFVWDSKFVNEIYSIALSLYPTQVLMDKL